MNECDDNSEKFNAIIHTYTYIIRKKDAKLSYILR